MNDNYEYSRMIDEMLEKDCGFSSWEIDFLEDMEGRERFTDGQRQKIEQIYQNRM